LLRAWLPQSRNTEGSSRAATAETAASVIGSQPRFLVRTGAAFFHRQRIVEQQHALRRPFLEIAVAGGAMPRSLAISL
jgi:hypothetical protein